MTPGFLDGMLLAATAADDPSGAAALAGLAPGLARALRARALELAARPTEARREEISRLAGELRAVDPAAELPPAAQPILAAALPRDVGRRWAASAPPVRRGFRVHPALRATLRRFAYPSKPGAEDAELAAAETADPRLRPWAARLAGREEPARVLGALALGATGDLRGDADSARWRRIGAELASVWGSPWRA